MNTTRKHEYLKIAWIARKMCQFLKNTKTRMTRKKIHVMTREKHEHDTETRIARSIVTYNISSFPRWIWSCTQARWGCRSHYLCAIKEGFLFKCRGWQITRQKREEKSYWKEEKARAKSVYFEKNYREWNRRGKNRSCIYFFLFDFPLFGVWSM